MSSTETSGKDSHSSLKRPEIRGGIVTLLVVVGLVYWIPQTVTLVGLSFLFAYVLNPFVENISGRPLGKRQLGRDVGVALIVAAAFTLIILILVFLLPQVGRQAEEVFRWIPVLVNRLQETLGREPGWLDWLREATSSVDWTGPLRTGINTIFGTATAVFGWAFTFVILPFLTFYWLREYPKFVVFANEKLSHERMQLIVPFVKRADEVLSGFLRGQLLVMTFLATWYSFVFGFLGLNAWLFLGITSGLLNFIPYLGPTLGAIFVTGFWLIGGGDSGSVWYILGAFLLGNLAENAVLAPKVLGDKVGLSPLGVLVSLLVAGEAFGIPGLIIAIPVAAVIKGVLVESWSQTQERLKNGKDSTDNAQSTGVVQSKLDQERSKS